MFSAKAPHVGQADRLVVEQHRGKADLATAPAQVRKW
jgi:hypothetical protein